MVYKKEWRKNGERSIYIPICHMYEYLLLVQRIKKESQSQKFRREDINHNDELMVSTHLITFTLSRVEVHMTNKAAISHCIYASS